jgi:hypothetical protein
MSARSLLRSAIVASVLTVTALGAVGVTATAAGASVRVGGVDAGATAVYEACTHQVFVRPWTLEPVTGRYTVYVRTAVYDFTRGQWVWSGWYLADGITSLWVSASNPYRSAYVQYARYVGGWQYNAEYVAVTDALDNGFCV